MMPAHDIVQKNHELDFGADGDIEHLVTKVIVIKPSISDSFI